MTRLDFCLAHAARARRDAEQAPLPELRRRAGEAAAAWTGEAERLQQERRRAD